MDIIEELNKKFTLIDLIDKKIFISIRDTKEYETLIHRSLKEGIFSFDSINSFVKRNFIIKDLGINIIDGPIFGFDKKYTYIEQGYRQINFEDIEWSENK